MKFLSDENLMSAYKKARKSRKGKQEVYLWDLNMEQNLLKLKNDLELWTYVHGPYKNIILFDSKRRYISSPIFRDHIVHHMVHNVLYEVFDKRLIHTTYACRKWYGSHKAIQHLKRICKREPVDSYYLKMDISKYFYSINHSILKEIIFQQIKDQHLRIIIDKIIESYTTWNQFDELFDVSSKYRNNPNKWLPIGSILSQLFANIYLSKLDFFVKHTLKLKNYLRYMDDFLIIWDKNTLNNAKNQIMKFVYENLDVTIHPQKNSFNLVSDGIKFVWYRVYKNKIFVGKTTKIKTNKFLDILDTMDTSIFSKDDLKRMNNSLQSRLWVFKHCDFQLNYFKKRGNINIPSWRQCEQCW